MMLLMETRILPAAIVVLLLLSITDRAVADIFVYKDAQGVLHFTNVPSHGGFRLTMPERDGRASQKPAAPGNYEEIIRAAAERYGVDPDLIRAVIKAESDFDSRARSHKGAQGLMQLMPETAKLHNVGDVYNPAENVNGGVRHLKLLFDHFRGDLTRTLAAYNAGITAVERHGGVPPYSETREYVRRVMNFYDRYRRKGPVSIQEFVTR
jgi:soluble lytic murein transglycosylase-like protein